MAKTTKYTVTHPDGTVSKRSSARSYTFAIVSVPATDAARKLAFNRQADEMEARAARFEAAADAGKVSRRSRGLGINPSEFHAFDIFLLGTEVTSGRVTYCEINDRVNDENLHETWRKFVPAGVEVVRETKEDHSGEFRVAVNGRDNLIGKARERAAELRETAAKRRQEADEADKGGFEVLRWSSRRDLAEKALTEFEYVHKIGRTLQVVPVDSK